MNMSRKKRWADYKENEIFSGVHIPRNMFVFVRCDGRRFHRVVGSAGFRKPFDKAFMGLMVKSALSVFKTGFNPILAYLFSDEANFLFKQLPFNGRVEKIDSVIASTLSSAFTLELFRKKGFEGNISFDSRIVLIDKKDIIGYLDWRQGECWRNHNNSYAYHALIGKGKTPREASRTLRNLKFTNLHELVLKLSGLNLCKTPEWQRKGVLIYWERYYKEGFNPVRKEPVKALRRKLMVNWSPPFFSSDEGKRFLEELTKL